MRTVETKVYLFSELSDDAKQRAIDWYRSIDSFEIGAETVIENSKDIGGILGIEIEKIYYSGFFSQGGGACFEGNYFYNPDAVVKIKKECPFDEILADIAQKLDTIQKRHQGFIAARMQHRGYYYNSGCMQIEVFDRFDVYRDIGEDENLVRRELRRFADWIYESLQNQYDAEQEGEYIIECIEANDYEFTEDGKIYK